MQCKRTAELPAAALPFARGARMYAVTYGIRPAGAVPKADAERAKRTERPSVSGPRRAGWQNSVVRNES